MTKILVCSDSHGSKSKIDKLFKEYKFDYFVYLGDGEGDLGDYDSLENVYSVCGNCDFFSTKESQRVLNIAGKKIFITHGHKYGVKYSLATLAKYAKEIEADIALYGHTHSYNVEEIDNVIVANPGALKNNSAMLIVINDVDTTFSQILL